MNNTAPQSEDKLNAPLRLDATTALAAERTLLAWIRTGLAMMGFGFVIARFGLFLRELVKVEHLSQRSGLSLSLWFGGGMMLLGVAALLIASLRHVQLIRTLSSGTPYRARPFSPSVILTLLLAVLGLVMTGFVVGSAR